MNTAREGTAARSSRTDCFYTTLAIRSPSGKIRIIPRITCTETALTAPKSCSSARLRATTQQLGGPGCHFLKENKNSGNSWEGRKGQDFYGD
uniref:Uncharacterized protein n=1 Tax=Anguilla anguilla TaxID=7936 RepID=A0A0E9PTH3_ANGAN